MAEPRPAFACIEASSAAGRPEALLAALREVHGVVDAMARRHLIFGIRKRALCRDPGAIKCVVRARYAMALDGDVPDTEDESSCGVATRIWTSRSKGSTVARTTSAVT